MKATTFAKVTAGLAAAATMSFGLCTAATAAGTTPPTAAQEDPTTNGVLVGVGSDTIQDVEYGIGQDLGFAPDGTTPELSSWTATGGPSITYRSGLSVARPNGSGAGYKALEDSIGVTNAGLANRGDVDYARASGFQGTADANGNGVITEIPFAIDTISFAVPADSPFLLANGGKGLTVQNLADIYLGNDTFINTATGELGNTAGTDEEPIQAFVPKPGSGSRQFFLQQLNKVDTAVNIGTNKGDSLFTNPYPSTAVSPYVGAKMPNGSDVQEHDASVLMDAPSGVAAIAPFSAAKFIGYHNGLIADPSGKTAGTDYTLVPFDSAVSGAPSTGVLPFVNNGGVFAPNTAYQAFGTEGSAKLYREVFNIIPSAAVKNPNATPAYRDLYDTFVGKGSKFCLDSNTIKAYGFLVDSNCGSTAQTADAPSTATVTAAGTGKAGASTVVTVTAQSNGNGGGKAALTINGKAYTVTIPAGKQTDVSESAKITVPTPSAGTLAVSGTFTPTLAGVGVTPITGKITVAKATPKVVASAPAIKHTAKGKVNVTVTAPGLKPTGKVTVTIKLKSATKLTVSGKAIAASTGKVTVALTKALPKGTYDVYVSYTGDKNTAAAASKKLTTLKVS